MFLSSSSSLSSWIPFPAENNTGRRNSSYGTPNLIILEHRTLSFWNALPEQLGSPDLINLDRRTKTFRIGSELRLGTPRSNTWIVGTLAI
ncbi:hypothetical protein HanXRQr2_Chr14g0636951 [Helianthus annuus]|uniref:Uncharacterized protein n=1 Tax=Helianthus annuus TaxID=4232 RepID=A0A9K3E873_HELAN|nr:hypothetical protein HanXRQr2_Chr14g0636951 [Helianthus annuus]KAJ0839782.1 hypothetical protein HanPSC8_Chr14g0610941 [Helianthus annuus]